MADKMDTSSPESSGENNIATPKDRQPSDISSSSALSPPDSQQRNTNMPLSASGSSLANSNGKRPIQTISNGSDEVEEIASMGNGGVSLNGTSSGSKSNNYGGIKTHSSGYKWSANEDEPGYAWRNKKAQDDYKRAAEGMVHGDSGVRSKYGDLFEMVENERAVVASMQQG